MHVAAQSVFIDMQAVLPCKLLDVGGGVCVLGRGDGDKGRLHQQEWSAFRLLAILQVSKLE